MLLVMAAVGYSLGWLGWMKAEHKQFIVKLLLCFGVPMLTVKNMLADVSRDMFHDAGKLLLISFLSISVSLALGAMLARLLKIQRARFGGFVVMCGLSNSIFIGYPLCTQIFGDQCVPYLMLYYMVNTFMFWTVGEALLRRSGESGMKFSLSRCLKGLLTAPLITLAVCFALVYFNIKLPEFVLNLAGYMSGIVTPLALIYIGFLLYESRKSSIRIGWDMGVVMLFRFVASPMIMLLMLKLFNVSGLARGVLTLEAAMPTMTQSVMLSAAVGADDGYAARGMCLSCIACTVAVPLLALII